MKVTFGKFIELNKTQTGVKMFDLVPNLVAGSGNPLQAARGRYSGWFLDPQGQWVTGGRRVQ